METILSRHSKEDIISLLSRYYGSDVVFAVGSDATAGIKMPARFTDEDVKSCKARLINLGFEIVQEKHLTQAQKKNYDFFIFYSVVPNLKPEQQNEISDFLKVKFDEVEVKSNGAVICTKYTENRILSHLEDETLMAFMSKHCSDVKRLKMIVGISKYSARWVTK